MNDGEPTSRGGSNEIICHSIFICAFVLSQYNRKIENTTVAVKWQPFMKALIR